MSNVSARALAEGQWKSLRRDPDGSLRHWQKTLDDPADPEWMKTILREQAKFAGYDAPVEGANVMPLMFGGKAGEIDGANLPDWQIMMPHAAERLANEGLDYMRVRNVLDTPVAADYTYGAPLSDVFIAANPSNIRSRHARFDPRLKHNADLLASLAGAGFLGSMALPRGEDR